MTEPARVLYDGRCRFCRWALARVLRLDRPRALEPVALDSPLADELLRGMPSEERMSSWHLVEPDGSVRSGGAAAAPLARRLPAGRIVAALLGAAPRLVERAYGLVAANRGRLSGLVSARALARADALIACRSFADGKRAP